MVEGVIEQFGTIDILVNNAGIYSEHPLAEVDYDEWHLNGNPSYRQIWSVLPMSLIVLAGT